MLRMWRVSSCIRVSYFLIIVIAGYPDVVPLCLEKKFMKKINAE
jgi:hypothetical protein